MKTTRLFLFAIAVAAFGFFTSCTEEEATGPVIDFLSGEGMITEDDSVMVGESYSFKVLLTQGTAKLDEYTIRLGGLDLAGYPLTDIEDGTVDLYEDVMEEAGTYSYVFVVTDKDGMQDTKTIVVTVKEPVIEPTIKTYTDKVLGADDNPTVGSSFASADGSIYLLADAKTNSNKVDFVYFYGAENLATLAAPSNSDAQTVYASIGTWTTQNATVFGTTTITAAQFDAITTDTEIVAAATGLSATKANELAVDDVIAFETASTSAYASKKGLIKVVELSASKTGSITIEVKVQL